MARLREIIKRMHARCRRREIGTLEADLRAHVSGQDFCRNIAPALALYPTTTTLGRTAVSRRYDPAASALMAGPNRLLGCRTGRGAPP
jgi:hypothetical protein